LTDAGTVSSTLTTRDWPGLRSPTVTGIGVRTMANPNPFDVNGITIIVARRAMPEPMLATDRSTNRLPFDNVPDFTSAVSSRGVPTATVTVEEATPVLPLASRNPNVTDVVPIGKSVVAATGAPLVVAANAVGDASATSREVADSSHAFSAGQADTRVPSRSTAGIASAAGAVTTGTVVSRTITRAVDVADAP
jgi:hypothetical protein